MNTHNPFSTFLDYWRQLQGWDSVRVPLWICTLWDVRYLLDFWIKRCSRTTVYPHTIWSTSCSNTICTLLRSSCSSLVVLEEYTEELSLCRAVCITSVINWILPRADFVEHFFLLFLRLDHLFAGSSLLWTAANAKGNQMFPTIPYNHTVIFFPHNFTTQFSAKLQFWFFVSELRSYFLRVSFLLPSASFIFWELVKQSSALGDKPAPLLPFTVSVLEIIWVFGKALLIYFFSSR